MQMHCTETHYSEAGGWAARPAGWIHAMLADYCLQMPQCFWCALTLGLRFSPNTAGSFPSSTRNSFPQLSARVHRIDAAEVLC